MLRHSDKFMYNVFLSLKIFMILLLKTILSILLIFNAQISTAKKTKNSDPIAIVTIAPNYPRSAAEKGIEGKVTLEFTITTTGTVTNPIVISSSPENVFDREALRAILKFKFAPAIKKGKAIESTAQQTIFFKLPKGYTPEPLDG